MPEEPQTIDDDLADDAADLIREADDQLRENRAEQEAFLETVAEEEGAEVLETKCNLIGDYTVPLKAKMNGDLIDRMGHIEERLERVMNEEARAYEVGDAADDASQLLDDAIDDPKWDKETFYEAYRSEGLDPLGEMIKRVFEALQSESERRQGAADGFRQKPERT